MFKNVGSQPAINEHFHNYYYGSILIDKTIVDYIFSPV